MASSSVSTPDILPKRRLQRANTAHRPTHYSPSSGDILHAASFNKGTAFTSAERARLRLRGRLPPRIETLDEQVARVLSQMQQLPSSLGRYSFLATLLATNETLFYRTLSDNLEALMPIVYTPTVGEACTRFGNIFQHAHGLYLSLNDRSEISAILDQYLDDVHIIVVTDGSRILGLGDLGANGMGIPIGKLSLYVAAGGFHPRHVLPIQLDVGTNNEGLLSSQFYLGMRQRRCGEHEYEALVDEFVAAVSKRWPGALLQFEDFSTEHAFQLLARHRGQARCFNDDIQGTGAVVLAGFIAASRLQRTTPTSHRIVFVGAGSAAVGVADQLVAYLVAQGMSSSEARALFYLIDSHGLVTKHRLETEGLPAHKEAYAQEADERRSLVDVIRDVHPTVLIGLSGVGGAFTQEAINEMARHTPRPIIFALSNPTANAECTAQQAYEWTEGQVIFAGGSPFDIEHEGRKWRVSQCNNMYIFPGLGLAAWLCQTKTITDEMVMVAAVSLAEQVKQDRLDAGLLYPPLASIREISANIATACIEQAFKEGNATIERPEDIGAFVRSSMYTAEYLPIE